MEELAKRYTDEGFQSSMTNVYKKNIVTQDHAALLKAKQKLCMPIQAAVLPNYGFEPNFKGVAMAAACLTTPEMMQDPKMQELHGIVSWLTKEGPEKAALDSAVG